MIKKILLFLLDIIFSTSDDSEKTERGYWNKSNSYNDKQRYPGEEVHRDEYGNYIDENGDIDPYK